MEIKYQLYFYVPQTHLEEVKSALFKSGAGQMDTYQKVCWQTTGIGQFEPSENSNAFIGTANSLEEIEEIKVEMIVPESQVNTVKQTLLSAHPYEVPAYGFIQLHHA